MLYSLWDIETNNLVAERRHRCDALSIDIEGIRRNGPHDTYALSLDVEDDDGEVRTIAYGAELAQLAKREFALEQLAR